MEPAKKSQVFGQTEQISFGREVLLAEGAVLQSLAQRIGNEFCQTISLMHSCPGSIVVMGMGKAGIIGQKIAATLTSTGTVSHFLHPAEAVHGDLGRIQPGDVTLILSFSGETDEVCRLIPSLRRWNIPIVALTSRRESQLGTFASIILELGPLQEICPMGLAPTTSTTAMLAVGDALALTVSRLKNFGPDQFARFHPGGNLGRSLSTVDEKMRPLSECHVSFGHTTVRSMLILRSRPGRRTGAVMVVDDRNVLVGIFTDSDLARLLERQQNEALDSPISEVMTREPKSISSGSLAMDAIEMLADQKISELPVVGPQGFPLGIIDITDVIPAPIDYLDNENQPDTIPFRIGLDTPT